MTDRRAAPPSRWLLALTLAVVAVFTVVRVLLAAQLDLRSDEAYYWSWTRQSPLSFLDQPPMVAWFERIGIVFFGDTPLGARFAQLLSLPLIQLMLADIARRRTGNWNAALLVVLATECALNYGLFTIVVEPSTPLLLFTSLMLWGLCRLDETMDGRWWLLAGVAGGLALLSKYIVLLLAPAPLVFLLLTPKHRRWLRTGWPYAAVLIALALFSPVLIWNARHGGASFVFQSVRLGGGNGLETADFLRFALYETLFVGPVLLAGAIAGGIVLLVRSLRRQRPFEAAVALAFVFPLAFFAARSLSLQINQSWAWFLWPLGMLALALALPWGRAPRRIGALIGAIVLTGVPLVGGFFWHALFDRAVWFGPGDPFGQDAGFGEMSERVLADARANGAGWIAATDYRSYANLLWHIGDHIPVVQVNQRARFLDFAKPGPARFAGTALYVHPGPADPLLAGARLTPLETVPVTWRGVEMQTMQVDLLDGFTPELDPPPGSPAYVTSNQVRSPDWGQ